MKFDSPPNKMVMPLSSFDTSLLPEGRRDSLAIHEYLTRQFTDFGVQARIVVGPDTIEIDWSGDVDVVASCIRLLERGNGAKLSDQELKPITLELAGRDTPEARPSRRCERSPPAKCFAMRIEAGRRLEPPLCDEARM